MTIDKSTLDIVTKSDSTIPVCANVKCEKGEVCVFFADDDMHLVCANWQPCECCAEPVACSSVIPEGDWRLVEDEEFMLLIESGYEDISV